jgi:hypothetical protein
MARTAAGVVALVAVLTVGLAARIDASRGPEIVVVLHVTDGARVSAGVLAEAEQQAALVYHAAGVRAVWTDGHASTAEPDGAFHVDVVLLSKEQVVEKCQLEEIAEQVFGRAARPDRRAYIFYNRIFDHARLTRSSVARLLGAVIAHEVGHLLLPAFSHSTIGIMRAHWEGRLVHVPSFTADQGTTIRTMLAAATAK